MLVNIGSLALTNIFLIILSHRAIITRTCRFYKVITNITDRTPVIMLVTPVLARFSNYPPLGGIEAH